MDFDPVLLLRTAFLAGAVTGFVVNSSSALTHRYLAYGSRSQDQLLESHAWPLIHAFDGLLRWKVPHSYFSHFYVLSLCSSLFWGVQILYQGRVIHMLAPDNSFRETSMTWEQVLLVWALMAIHGSRRLIESNQYMKRSNATMPISLYLVGLAYYTMLGVAIWIEGTEAIFNRKALPLDVPTFTPSIRTIIFLPIFIIASGVQNDCHAYLASLPKYTLPVHPVFQNIVCPHYMMECLIYLALAGIAAPKGELFNKTLLTNLLWVIVQLGFVAKSTKEWSKVKFGPDKIEPRWRMIPGVW